MTSAESDGIIFPVHTKERKMLIRSDVHSFLKNLGIKSSDTVVMHTSMKALGEVEGGCDGLIDFFKSHLCDGLFVIPTHTWASVGHRVFEYDPKSSVPCIGALPTVAAFRPDGVRSLHPTHSVAAFGNRAAEFVKGEEKSTSPCPVGGVWSRFYDENAKILLVGVGMNRNTYIHAIDEKIDLPDRLTPPVHITVKDGDNSYETDFRRHSSGTGSENFGVFEKPLAKLGAITYAKLGNADVMCVDARKCTEIIEHLWRKAEYHLCKELRDIPTEYYSDLL